MKAKTAKTIEIILKVVFLPLIATIITYSIALLLMGADTSPLN